MGRCSFSERTQGNRQKLRTASSSFKLLRAVQSARKSEGVRVRETQWKIEREREGERAIARTSESEGVRGRK
eukprot:1890612-Alexandrium_andersonii.AAC.1